LPRKFINEESNVIAAGFPETRTEKELRIHEKSKERSARKLAFLSSLQRDQKKKKKKKKKKNKKKKKKRSRKGGTPRKRHVRE